jgi:cytochrome c-type biogenesis protein CcsB
MKTVNTLNNEFVRKIVGKEKLGSLTPDQLVLSLMAYPEYWSSYPFVKIKNSELREQLSVQGKYASFEYFFDNQKQYRLSGMINHVFKKPKNQQNKTDKALIELDDKINIIHGFVSGRALSIFPIHEADNHKWHNVTDAWQYAVSSEDSLYLQNIIGVYLIELRNGMKSGDFSNADQYLESIKVYQEAVGKEVIPEKGKLKAELFYNKASLFKWLKIAYGMVGLLSLLMLLFLLFGKGTFNPGFTTVLTIVALVLIVFHSAGIGLRWYIGGFVPLSNAYETMIFISWIGVLSGIVIARKQPLALALSLLVGFTFLLVAGFNNSNPEIGNLVPVLKSPWLSIHVAVITSSYALFAIVMLAAFINIVAFLVMNTSNQKSVRNRVTQLGHMMQVLLVVGLYTLTIGTIFGAVWANESWGRYWGWDPKETWALISIFVYAFVSHMRLIPSLKNDFWFNLSAFWAFAAILMTFFGVNYFLTGMHSYAGTGDAVIPTWLFWMVLTLIVLSVSSGIRELRLRKTMKTSAHDE